MTINIEPPFNLESLLAALEESEHKVMVYYTDDSFIVGFVTEEYNRQTGKLEYIIIENEIEKGIPYHYVDLQRVTKLTIVT